jgi:hypothetical protein
MAMMIKRLPEVVFMVLEFLSEFADFQFQILQGTIQVLPISLSLHLGAKGCRTFFASHSANTEDLIYAFNQAAEFFLNPKKEKKGGDEKSAIQ